MAHVVQLGDLSLLVSYISHHIKCTLHLAAVKYVVTHHEIHTCLFCRVLPSRNVFLFFLGGLCLFTFYYMYGWNFGKNLSRT